MATKAKSKGKGDQQSAVSGQPPAAIDLLEIDGEVTGRVEDYAGWNRSPYGEQVVRVRELRQLLQLAEAKLRAMAAPLIAAAELLAPERLKALADSEPYDEALRKIVGPVKPVRKDRVYVSGKSKTVEKKTGAKPWKELQEAGASDKQLAKNLESVFAGTYNRTSKVGDWQLTLNGTSWALQHVVPAADYGWDETDVVKGKPAIVAAVRRVMGIPQAVAKAAKKPVAQKAAAKPKSSTKPKAAAKKPSAKGGPKPAAKKTSAKPKPKAEIINKAAIDKQIAKTLADEQSRDAAAKLWPRLAHRNLLQLVDSGGDVMIHRVDGAVLRCSLKPADRGRWDRESKEFPADGLGLLPAACEEFLVGAKRPASGVSPEEWTATNGKPKGKAVSGQGSGVSQDGKPKAGETKPAKRETKAAEAGTSGRQPAAPAAFPERVAAEIREYVADGWSDNGDGTVSKGGTDLDVAELLTAVSSKKPAAAATFGRLENAGGTPYDPESIAGQMLSEVGRGQGTGDSDAPGRAARNLALADREAVLGSLKPMHRAILNELIAAHPATMSRSEAVTSAGYKPGGKTNGAIKELIKAGHVTASGRSDVAASDSLFAGEAATA